MKRNTIIAGVALAVTFIVVEAFAFSPSESPIVLRDFSTMPEIGTAAVRLFNPVELSQVEGESKLIVQGKLHNDAQEHLQIADRGTYQYVLYGCTTSSLEVTKVYQGDVAVGDILPFVEPYYIQNIEGVDTIIHRDAYLPSSPGKEYLFFLDFSENYGTVAKVYYAKGAELGRYPVLSPSRRATFDPESIPNRQLDVSEYGGGLYKAMYQEAIDKYMSN